MDLINTSMTVKNQRPKVDRDLYDGWIRLTTECQVNPKMSGTTRYYAYPIL